MVAEIVPEFCDVKVPIVVGLANDPAAFESWAVNTFPATKVPVIVKGTETAVPAQNGDPEIVPVVMVATFCASTKKRFVLIAFEFETPKVPVVPPKDE
jgi:hypothetical protein